MTSWLVRLSPDQALARAILLASNGQDTLLSQWLSPLKCVNDTSEFNARGVAL